MTDLRVVENQTRSSAILLDECRRSRIRGCLVRNYLRISVDDRTDSSDWGYAFKCIIGSGINVKYSTGTLIEGCSIVEDRLISTPEVVQKFNLGDFVKKNAEKDDLVSQKIWEAEYSKN